MSTEREQENQQQQATIKELAQGAREHYQNISEVACHWNSLIPQAIDAWEREQLASVVPREQEEQEQAGERERLLGDFDANLDSLRVAASNWSFEAADFARDRLRRAYLRALRAPVSPPGDLAAVVEGVAVEFMEEWKHARFQHASAYAQKMAARVVEIMSESQGDSHRT